MKSKKNIYLYIILTLLTFANLPEAWGQATGTPIDYYNGNYSSTITIKTKYPKWYYLRQTNGMNPNREDKYKADESSQTFQVTIDQLAGTKIQASHVLVDTIYVHKGTKYTLSLPNRLNNDYSIKSYQRWYNLRTGKTFEVTNGVKIGSNTYKDLLYPTTGPQQYASDKPQRYSNGYVSGANTDTRLDHSLLDMYFYYPTDEQYNSFTNVNPDNKEYLIACDVSSYTDYMEKYKKGASDKDFGYNYEPTLSCRIIYCIRAIENENDWRHKFFEEQKNVTNKEDQKYLEEYEISMPSIRIPDRTLEMVSLATAANAYAVPVGTGENDPERLSVNLETGSNTAKITLQYGTSTITLSGTSRIIYFKFPDTKDNFGRESVPDGSTATILVTKTVGSTTYRIARFKLTFKESSVFLTQSLIDAITKGTGESWNKYKYRTPTYLHENYTFVAGIDFDFDPAIAGKYGLKQVYPYPLEWSESSYAFYDGSVTESFQNGNVKEFLQTGNKYVPQWGYYAIVNDYTECSGENWGIHDLPHPPKLPPVTDKFPGVNSTYHMFIDASDQPGVIARLKFDTKLCPGSELFVSAAVKVAKAYAPNVVEDNAAMLFTIMGVSKNKNNRDVYTPIYRHQTGQIPGTYIESGSYAVSNIPGFGSSDGKDGTISNNQWLQVYFSFTNRSDTRTDFDSYVLQIDNNSASTAGADMYIDDIRVYIAPTKAEVKQKSPTCNSNKVDALLQMRLDWDRLLSRLGVEEKESSSEEAKAHVSFCFVDSAAYITKYKALGSNPTEKACEDAFKESIIKLSYPIQNEDGNEDKTTPYEFGKLLFDPCYESKGNKEYEPEKTNYQIDITDIKDAGHFYRLTDEQGKSVTADIYCALKPFHTYFLVLEENHDQEEHNTNESYIPDIERFKYFYMEPLAENSCVAKTSFQLEAMNSIKVNGMLSENTDQTFCNGQIVNFGVQLRADTNGDGKSDIITEEVYHDWYLSPLAEFQKEVAENSTSNSIQQALIDFRSECPEATTLDDWNTDNKTEKDLLIAQVESGKLILRQANLNAHVKSENKTFSFVVIPIPMKLGESDNQVIICTDPLEVTLNVDGSAPEARVGFEDVIYPDERDASPDQSYHSVVRLGKNQLVSCSSATTMLELPLKAKAGTDGTIPQLGKSDAHPHLYLIDSNDPVVLAQIAQIDNTGTFDNTTWPVAIIDAINATSSAGSKSDPTATGQYMRLHFGKPEVTTKEEIPTANFREGYRYTLLAYFTNAQSKSGTDSNSDTPDGSNPVSTCEGSLVFDLKVVPKYQKWSGSTDGSGNWNNDANWLRSTANELHKVSADATSYDEGYPKTDEARYGFVPMDFTKVTIPEGKKVQLYKATENMSTVNSSATHSILNLVSNNTSITDVVTQYIEYDLMVKEAETNNTDVAYDCKTYYTNTADQIHFEPDAEMLHAEYLNYNTAWVDYKLNGGQWYTLASPLQGVVAGDWYTQNTGQQTTEYFKGINFNTTDYSRFQPSVYQRGWKEVANMITIGSGSSNIDDNRTVAIAGNWSAVYNDVTVPYEPGQGFSVKVLNLPTTENNSSALFRFPKADTNYSYYQSENTTTGTNSQNITRSNPGELKSNELKDKDSFEVLLEAQNGESDYYLIGNPFMAHLNAQEFFNVNTNLQPKFWLVTEDNQSSAVGSTDNGWITTETGSKTAESPTIAPLQSFFVQKKTNSKSTEATTVTFNADMQELGSTDTGLKSSSVSSVSSPVLTLTATTADGHRSRAAIAYDPAASDEYKANEDAELFLDSNLGNVPAVYTVAGTMATSINRTPVLWNIPVGIYGNSNGNVTLSFDNPDLFPGTTLYDAEKKTETALHNGYTLTVPANTCGRYFLRAGTPTGNEKIGTETIRIYTVARRQLIVTATENLQTVSIYDFAGRLLRHFDNLTSCVLTTYLDKGNYIVKATGKYRQETCKIQIR
ncbi:hypothetical protein [Parabacteroides sp.]